LFYRLNVIPLMMRPLRERREDIPLLVTHFLKEMSPRGTAPPSVTPGAMSIFTSRDWPGNIRELKNVLERLIIMTSGVVIDEVDLPDDFLGASRESAESRAAQQTLKDAKSDFERAFILGKLEENDWNISRTADALNIERSNLHRKLKSYDIDPKKMKG